MTDATTGAPTPAVPTDFLWPACGHALLRRDDRGWLLPTDDWLRLLIARPELAPIAASCASERALHDALLERPTRPVPAERLARLRDPDARESYGVFVAFRDALLAAGSFEACYASLFGRGRVDCAPVFVDLMVQVMLRGLLDGGGRDAAHAFEARAAETLFRPQRVAVQEGRVLAADLETVEHLKDTGGVGEIGRLLRQAQAPLRAAAPLTVLTADTAAVYWAAAAADRHPTLLDLTHELTRDIGDHGLRFAYANAGSALPALSRVLERWVAHLVGVDVAITPMQRIDDDRWRWHVGLDAESSALLDDLYRGEAVDDDRLRRLVGLFRLDFADASQMRADVAGRPVYLGVAHRADGTMRVKPQNLLLNLPLAAAS